MKLDLNKFNLLYNFLKLGNQDYKAEFIMDKYDK